MTSRLLDKVADLNNLDRAWRELEANDAEDGLISPAVAAFARNRFAAITELGALLLAQRYEPQPLTEVRIPKPDGGVRVLHLSLLTDRIVERAVAQVVTPFVDPRLGPWSFAYRPGLGVQDAAFRLAELRRTGHTHVLRADIRDCFPSIDVRVLLQMLELLLNDAEALHLVARLLDRPVFGQPPHHRATGLPQGSPLSPVLANLFLSRLDDQLLERGFPAVRYADDLAIPVPGAKHAERARTILAEVAAAMGMELGEPGGEVMSFEDGFAFLGEEFSSTWPPDSMLEPIIREPEKRVLYIANQGALLRTSKGQMLVELESERLLEVPVGLVSRVVLFGAVALSAGARAVALDNEIDIVLLSRRGRHQGALSAGGTRSARLRRLQLTASGDPVDRCEHARSFVLGKVANQIALLQRYSIPDDRFAEQRQQLVAVRPMLEACEAVEVLLGVEGAAARSYFGAFGRLLPEPFRFGVRSRRPPLDPVNACLSFGYALLTGEAVSAAAAAGLDPAVGFLHGDDDGRPSLALDLIEEFRPLVVDTTVLSLFRRERLTTEHFRSDDRRPGVLLTEEGRRRFISAFETRMLTVFAHVPSGKRVSYRRAMHLQAVQLASVLRDRSDSYRPVSWR